MNLLTDRERQMVALNPVLRRKVGTMMRARALGEAAKYQKLSLRDAGQFEWNRPSAVAARKAAAAAAAAAQEVSE